MVLFRSYWQWMIRLAATSKVLISTFFGSRYEKRQSFETGNRRSFFATLVFIPSVKAIMAGQRLEKST